MGAISISAVKVKRPKRTPAASPAATKRRTTVLILVRSVSARNALPLGTVKGRMRMALRKLGEALLPASLR